VTKDAQSCDVPFLPGVSTPTEVIQALELGLDVLKFFPAHLNGGIPALKAFGQVFPQVSFCPTGGITQETSKNYLALANVFAVGGSWFQKDFHN
jgi:2-dehydro-3-deoxyphosphogluconate aldolase/(4S)-4-hydroxy-2-oxoglutarate aldolase